MSDHDPLDRAYAQAEAMLDDEAARAARRARVLDAVAADAKAPPVAPPKRRPSWAAGAWLAAASVAGVSLLLAYQLSVPPIRPAPTAPPPAAPASAPEPEPTAPPAASPPVTAAPAPAPTPAPDATTPPAAKAAPAPAAYTPPAMTGAPLEAARVAPAPAAPPPPPPAPAPPPAQASEGTVDALIVTGQKREEEIQSAPTGMSPFSQESMKRSRAPAAADLSDARTTRLHAAATAGRLRDLKSLLAQGVPVDATDAAGETALMKAVRARKVEAAALLVGHGASLDRANRAGVSAREMAEAIDDPGLDRALGLER